LWGNGERFHIVDAFFWAGGGGGVEVNFGFLSQKKKSKNDVLDRRFGKNNH
jgi:hypothetical protein